MDGKSPGQVRTSELRLLTLSSRGLFRLTEREIVMRLKADSVERYLMTGSLT